MTCQNSHVRLHVSLIGSGEGRHTTHLLKCVLLLSTSQTDWKQFSDILSDISFDILSDISSDISFDMLSDIFWHSFWQIFWHSFWHIFWHIFLTYFLTYLLTFFLAYLLTFFLTYLVTWSRLRSGAEHWTHRIAVEVRHGTLNSHDHGWGPTQNTDEEEEDEEEEKEARDTARIQSNNPHLTGGEQKYIIFCMSRKKNITWVWPPPSMQSSPPSWHYIFRRLGIPVI